MQSDLMRHPFSVAVIGLLLIFMLSAQIVSLFMLPAPIVSRRRSENVIDGQANTTADEDSKVPLTPVGLSQQESVVVQCLQKYSKISMVPPPARKYFTCICTVTRNELHLKEFLIRNILAGVNHIFVYDNNRILINKDTNISRVLRPFVEAGFITHISFQQNVLTRMSTDIKHIALDDCFNNHVKPNCVYGSTIDTDEIWYPQDLSYLNGFSNEDNGGLGQLRQVIEHLEQKFGAHTTGFASLWDMVYAEHRILKGDKPLLLDFPRSCGLHRYQKSWYAAARTSRAWDHVPDPASGFAGAVEVNQEYKNTNGSKQPLWMIHYWYKSVEEFLLKKEVSFSEFRREISHVDNCPGIRPYPYSKKYMDIVQWILQGILHVPDSGDLMIPLDTLTISFANQGPLWAEYMFFKWAVARGYEWDEVGYLSHPANQQALQSSLSKYADGLEHFKAEGFLKSTTVPCFITQNEDRLCLRPAD